MIKVKAKMTAEMGTKVFEALKVPDRFQTLNIIRAFDQSAPASFSLHTLLHPPIKNLQVPSTVYKSNLLEQLL